MILAIPVTAPELGSSISARFGRSAYFAIVDKAEMTVRFIENPFVDKAEGVGKKLIELLASKEHVDALIAFELGLKVKQFADDNKLQLIILNGPQRSFKKILGLLDFTGVCS